MDLTNGNDIQVNLNSTVTNNTTNIYNDSEQYKAHIADLQTNLRENGLEIEYLISLAKELLADAAQRLQKYPTIPQSQHYISTGLIPLQEFFNQFE